MNNTNTITLYTRGNKFYEQDPTIKSSDIGSYRVVTNGYVIHGKSGRDYLIDFSHWNRYEYRTTNKRTGAPLKHIKRELLNENALHLDTQYEEQKAGDRFPSCYRDITIEREIHDMKLSYTTSDIEKAIEYITGKKCKVIVEEGIRK